MRPFIALAAVLSLAACAAGKVTDPFESTFLSNGLEQELRVTPAPQIDDTGVVFSLTSRLINRGSAPITVRVVTCYLDPANLRSSAELVPRAIPGCAPSPDVITLAPGEASTSLSFMGQLDRPGRHTIKVRHALDPEFWGEIRVRAH